jgi:hypothetical protein
MIVQFADTSEHAHGLFVAVVREKKEEGMWKVRCIPENSSEDMLCGRSAVFGGRGLRTRRYHQFV